MRAYRRDEVTNGLEWAGLELEAVYGGFDGEPFGGDSERMILVGRNRR